MKEKWDDVKSKKSNKIQKERPVQSNKIAATAKTVSEMAIHEFDEAHEKYVHNMTSEEAQRELLDIFILSVMLNDKLLKLSNARIVEDGGAPGKYIGGKEIIQKLSTPEYVASINQILENNPLLLQEKSASLSEVLGRSIVLNGQYVPIETTSIEKN